METDKKIITFDVWDTLIKRTCHPQEIKMHTCRYYYNKYYEHIKEEYRNELKLYFLRDAEEVNEYDRTRKLGQDPECDFVDVLLNFVKISIDSLSIKKAGLSEKQISEDLVNIEVEREKEKTYVNPYITEYLDKYKKHDKYVISDFYMSEKYLVKILEHHGLKKLFKKIYVSVDLGKTKRDNGNLFKYFIEKEKVLPQEMVHHGDSQHSDINMAQIHGIDTVLIPNPPKYVFDSFNLANIDFGLEKLKKEVDTKKENINKLNDKNLKQYKNTLYNQGIEFAPLAFFYVYNAIEEAHKKGYDKIYYQTREGETFIKYHQIIEESNCLPYKVPKAELIEVSRVATFGPSIKKFDIESLMRLWSQYRNQSMIALFKSLGLDIERYEKHFKKYRIDIKRKILEPYFYPKFLEMMKDEEFINQVEKELANKRQEFLKYLKQIGIENRPGDSIYLVDIGWRGTIQDNIAYILDEVKIEGMYIALLDYYNVQPKNTQKSSLFDNKGVVREAVSYILSIYETIFMSDSHSVAGYENGKAIRKGKKEEKEYMKNIVSNIQKGMIDGAKHIAEYVKEREIVKEMYVAYLEEEAIKLKKNPPKILAEVFYGLIYNETFGTGEYAKSKDKITGIQKLNIIYVRNRMRTEVWKEMFLQMNNIKPYGYIFGLKQRIKYSLTPGGKLRRIIEAPKKATKFVIRKVIKKIK